VFAPTAPAPAWYWIVIEFPLVSCIAVGYSVPASASSAALCAYMSHQLPSGKRSACATESYHTCTPSSDANTPLPTGYSRLVGTEEFYFYGIGGQKLATMVCVGPDDGQGCGPTYNVYFGGKLVKSKGAVVATDRLGSVRASSTGDQMTYYPYGEERTSTADNREKFGTYTRDNVSQDYADQRYYAVGMGRFNTPDPLGLKGVNPANPGSWNRYRFAAGDPVNLFDPKGLVEANPDGCDDDACWDDELDPEGGEGGGGAGGMSVTSTFAPLCSDGYVSDGHGGCDLALSPIAQQTLGTVGALTSGLGQASTWAAIAAGSAAAGSAVAAGLAATSGAVTAPSVLYGDIQASFNFGASVQPTITSSINVSRVFGPTGVPGQSQMLGSWTTTSPITSSAQAISSLALGTYNLATQIVQGTITAGATVVIGTAAAQSGQPGGGLQIFVQGLSCVVFGTPCPLP
jgi:RHS repeat-associated protein